MKTKFRNGYEENYESSSYATPMNSKSECQQHFKNDCDINLIVRRYRPSEIAAMQSGQKLTFDPDGVFLEFSDFQSQMERIASASSAFEELPASVRKDFKNDPARLIEAIEQKTELAYQHGFLVRKEQPVSKEPEDKSEGV